ncbi:DUF4314 domain-containing protein [Corynebacterium diphtheriae]
MENSAHNKERAMRINADGQRIRLVSTSDLYTRLAPGDEGAIMFVDDAGTVHVDWDCGSTLGRIPGEDARETLPESGH